MIVGAAVLALCVVLIVVGQRTVSFAHLGLMLLGLAGILVLLYLYNRSYVKTKPVKMPDEQENKSDGTN